ncbi:MAG: class I SAM-dependent methyltransferase [archaeon]|nr:class I SAM-dependent methyltransferase [archaeon]
MKSSLQKTVEYYNSNSEKWANKSANPFAREKEFRKFVSLLPKKADVLDIGCAQGTHVPLFLGIGKDLNYSGFDISNKLLKIARRRYPQLSFHQGNIINANTFPKKKFDGFWAVAVLMHMEKELWPLMLDNIEKHMKSGAIGFFTLPHSRPSLATEKDQRHFSFFTKGELDNIIKKRNWMVLNSGVTHGKTAPVDWSWYMVKLS